MKRLSIKLCASLLLIVSLLSGFIVSAEGLTEPLAGHVEFGQTPKNIILFIPDGMGTNDIKAYRQYKNGGFDPYLPLTVMDHYLVGSMSTTPNNDVEGGGSSVTDSAAAGTAMACGVKTYSGAIGVDIDGNPIKNASEVAKSVGKSVGIIATSDVFHATPASFHSHVSSRKDYAGMIANMVTDLESGEGVDFDLLLGGGQNIFKTDERDYTKLFTENGFEYVENLSDLKNSDSDMILGLFAEGALPYHWDTVEEDIPTLAEMTAAAIEVLSKNENGFFLMVEASQIDWANHANDLLAMFGEIEGYEEAFQIAVEFAKENGDTLLLAGADHDTGGFTVSGGENQQFLVEDILEIKYTPGYIASQVTTAENLESALAEYIPWQFTNADLMRMEDAIIKGEGYNVIFNMLKQQVNERTNAGWSTGQHTGGDVSFYAYGPGFENFIGYIENSEVGELIQTLILG